MTLAAKILIYAALMATGIIILAVLFIRDKRKAKKAKDTE